MEELLPKIFDIHTDTQLVDSTELTDGIETSFKVEGSDNNHYFIKFLTSEYFEPEGFICGGELLPLLQEQNIPVPSLIYCSEPKPHIGNKPFYITEYVEGKTVSGYGDINVQSIEQFRTYFRDLGKYTARLHSLPVNSHVYGWAGWFNDQVAPFGGYDSFSEWVGQEVHRYGNKLTDSHSCSERKDQIQRLSQRITTLDVECSDPVICTYDRKFENVILEETFEPRAKALIDWDNPVLAPPEYMLSRIEKHYVTHPRMDSTISYDLESVLPYVLEGYQMESGTTLSLQDSLVYTICRIDSFVSDIRHFDRFYEDYPDSTQDLVREQLFGALDSLEEQLESY
jgi:hypothetical protein